MESYPGPILIQDPDPSWPKMFEKERERIAAALRGTATTIEHVGSTAVAGLAAKPIIDMLIEVSNLERARSGCISAVTGLGYTHMVEYEAWLPGELLFRKIARGVWTHHVHVTERGSSRWEEIILIRDYLRTHPSARRDYEALKRGLALACGGDIAAFREGKAPFLRRLLEQARHSTRVPPLS